MKGTITMILSEILHSCDDWDKFCEDKGYSVWAVNEGGGHVEVTMEIEEADKYGIINIQEGLKESAKENIIGITGNGKNV